MRPLPRITPTMSSRTSWLLLAGFVVLLLVTAVYFVKAIQGHHDTLRLCIGEEAAQREGLVTALKTEGEKCGLHLILTPGSRGEETVRAVARGEQDAAIVFGGLGIEEPNVRQVACLRGEPLHLFVRPELEKAGLAGLLGKRINVGPRLGETQTTAKRVIQHMGITAGKDYQEEHHDIDDLLAMTEEELPDAIFFSSGLPSPLGKALVRKFDYRLLPIPFGPVLSLRNPSIFDIAIPAHTYRYHPAVPDRPIHTVGGHTMIIANRNVSQRAIYRFLELLCDSDLPRKLGKTPIDQATMLRVRDYPLHPGAASYFGRNDPWMSQKLVDSFANMKELIISAFSALLLMMGWLRRRPSTDYQSMLDEAIDIECRASLASAAGELDAVRRGEAIAALLRLRVDALTKRRDAALPGGQPLYEFLDRLQHIVAEVERLPASSAHRIAA